MSKEKQSPDEATSRQAFEKWGCPHLVICGKHGNQEKLSRLNDGYYYTQVNDAWIGWQARASHDAALREELVWALKRITKLIHKPSDDEPDFYLRIAQNIAIEVLEKSKGA